MTSTLPLRQSPNRIFDAFPKFAANVNRRFADFSALGELYVVDVPDLWSTYLEAFPPGTNPVFRTNTEHDCNCCKQFIRNLGPVVSLRSGAVATVWDGAHSEPYAAVAAALRDAVRSAPIKSVFRSPEGAAYGSLQSRDSHDPSIIWKHFYGKVNSRHRGDAAVRASLNTSAQLLQRALEEIPADTVRDLIDLIAAGGLYRGAEFLPVLQAFASLQQSYTEGGRSALLPWAHLHSPAARIRNTVIGTLLQDLAEGKPLDVAVTAFERKVAPINYRRPTAVATPAMIDRALASLREAGLESALERRCARLSDLSINDVLWVDSSAKAALQDPLRDLLMASATPRPIRPRMPDGQRITIAQLLAMRPERVALVLTPAQRANFVSLTAPVHADAAPLFHWDNNFAWSYDGDVTDVIRDRVAKAGGNVAAKLRVSLAWHNYDDLDIHCHAPGPYAHIYFGNKMSILDVDMNAGVASTRTPVENLSWTDRNLLDGDYCIRVHNFAKRESTDVGFTLQVAIGGDTWEARFPQAVANKLYIDCCKITISNGQLASIVWAPNLLVGPAAAAPGQQHWNVPLGAPVPVDTILTSPNHWEGAGGRGNQHWFFILRGCSNPEPTRGIYNEYLRPALQEHRKVLELLGAKTKCPPTEDQLAGVGFSSTVPAVVAITVNGRPYELLFGPPATPAG